MKMRQSVIPKPWGSEYIAFENRHLSIWLLNIKKGQKTSLHCHPNKKTGLILLNNEAKISLIERSFKIKGLSKIMIRSECFHQTEALGNDICVLEIETPKNKKNLVRIKDSYGRKNKGYESKSTWVKRGKEHLFIPNKNDTTTFYEGFSFSIKDLSLNSLNKLNPDSLIVVLNKCAFRNSEYNFCSLGEVLSVKTALFLANEYEINKNTKVMIISNEAL